MTESSQCELIQLAGMAMSDNEPSALSHEQVQQHLRTCPECRVALGRLAAVDAVFNNVERRRHEVDVWTLLSRKIAGQVRADQPGRAGALTISPHRRRRSIRIALAVSLILVAMCVRTVIYFQSQAEFSKPMVESGARVVAHSTPKPVEIPYGPVQQIDPEEFRRRYAKYFDKEYQQQQQTALRDRTDADHWRPSVITVREGPLGTLFIDDEGKVTLASKHPLVDAFSEGLAMVGTTVSDDAQLAIGGYGFIDQTGRLVVPGAFEAARRFSDGLAAVKKDGKYGYINRRGKVVVDFKYLVAEEFKDGIARVSLDRDNIENSTEFIDQTGRALFRARGDSVGQFSEGLVFANLPAVAVQPPDDQTVDRVAPARTMGYLNRRFEFALRIPPDMPGDRYFLGGREFHDGMAAVAIGHSSGERKGFISRDGELVIEGRFLQVQPFSEGLAAVSLASQPQQASAISERWGFVDKAGKMVIQPQFLWTEGFHEGKAAVIVKLEGDSATSPRGKWGFIDKQGTLLIEPRFYTATNFYNGLARVQDNPYSHGYINESGEYVWRLDEPSF